MFYIQYLFAWRPLGYMAALCMCTVLKGLPYDYREQAIMIAIKLHVNAPCPPSLSFTENKSFYTQVMPLARKWQDNSSLSYNSLFMLITRSLTLWRNTLLHPHPPPAGDGVCCSYTARSGTLGCTPKYIKGDTGTWRNIYLTLSCILLSKPSFKKDIKKQTKKRINKT